MAESWLTRTMQSMPGWLIWLLAMGIGGLLSVVAPIAILFVAMFLEPVVPSAFSVTSVASPSGTMVAVIEKVDNGMGFGQGRAYDEIHVVNRGASVDKHGNDSATVIFCDDVQDQRPQVRWTDDRHLSVRYVGGNGRPFTKPAPYGIVVSYDRLASATLPRIGKQANR